jgi:radical SAM protein with 4Fe4S-binding SPASM domain
MSISVYLKPTNFCTVDCDHCYLPEEVRAEKKSMSDETLEKTAYFLLEMIEKEKHQMLHITWHGGEPMMLKPEYYENAIAIMDKIIGRDRYTQSFQTSLIPYSSKWKNLFASRFDSFIGSSVDFTQRRIRNSTGSYLKKYMEKVESARADGMYIVPGMVPTRFEVGKGKEIVDWFVDNGFSEFNIERYSKVGVVGYPVDWPRNHHHSQFITEVFDAIFNRIKNGEKAPYVKHIVAGINGVLNNVPGDRWGGKCQKEFIVIEPDGSLNSCPDRALHEKPFSNLHDGADEFIKSPDRRNWIRIQEITHKKSHCEGCEFRSWCRSGCPVVPNGVDEGEKECSGYKSFLTHIKEFLKDENNLKLAKYYIEPLGETIIQDEVFN